MKPVFKSIQFVRGDTFFISRYLNDKDGHPLDIDPLTDEITFTMRESVGSTTEAVKKTLSNSGGITIASDGKVIITLNSSDTKDLDFGKYGYDIELIIGVSETNPFVRTPESGKIKLLDKDFSRQSGGAE